MKIGQLIGQSVSESPSQHMRNYLHWTYNNRSNMEPFVSNGFHLTAILFFNSCLEDLIRSYLRFKLVQNQNTASGSLATQPSGLQQLKDPYTQASKDVSGNLEFESGLYRRFTAQKHDALKRATFNQLRKEHKLILGESIPLFVDDNESFKSWDAINAFRNLIGHGGELRIDVSEEEIETNLGKVLDAHNKAGIPDTIKMSELKLGSSPKALMSVFDILMREDFMLYLSDEATKFSETYRSKVSSDEMFQYPDYLPKFAPRDKVE